jgi:1,4-alpha-glucan branching enzyme
MFTHGKSNRKGQVEILFTLPAEVGPVSVVGDFNGWDPFAHPMTLGADGHYRVAVDVPHGKSYAFRYLGDGGRWFDEEAAHEYDARGAIIHVQRAAAAATKRRAAAPKNGAKAVKPAARTARAARV